MQSRVLSMRRSRMLRLCVGHWQAIALAFALGALVIAPQIVFVQSPAYRGIEMIGSDAEEYYVARIQEVYDGYPEMGGVFIPEKNHPYLVPGLGENIVARLGQLVDQSAPVVNVSAKFLFPVITALLVYALVYVLSASASGALFASVLVIAGDAVFGGPRTLVRVLAGYDPITSFLSFARPVNPEVSAVFLFAALLVIGCTQHTNRPFTWRSIATLGALAGGALYISPFVSSFLFAFMGLSFLWFVHKGDYGYAKAMMLSIGVGLAAIVPFLLNLITLRQGPYYVETSIRQGLAYTHAPVVGFWLFALVGSLFVWPRRFSAVRPFFAVATGALIILLNQQVVTGIVVQPAHYHWYLTKPLVGLVLALFAVDVIERILKSATYRTVAYGLCCGVVFLSAALVQRASFNAHYAQAVDAQEYAQVFSFLQTMPSKQSVWANRTLSLYTPMYTQHDVPNNQYAQYDSVLQTYLERRLLLEYSLRDVPVTDALETMRAEREDIAFRLYGVHWRDQYGSYAALPDAFLERYAQSYKQISRQQIPELLRELGISVVVWDTKMDPAWNMDRIPGMIAVFNDARFRVYQVASTTEPIQLVQ